MHYHNAPKKWKKKGQPIFTVALGGIYDPYTCLTGEETQAQEGQRFSLRKHNEN